MTVVVTLHEEDLRLGLDDESKLRLLGSQRPMTLPLGVVSIDYATLEDFGRAHGQLLKQVLPAITGVSLEELASQGGVRVVEAGTDRLIWLWPRRC